MRRDPRVIRWTVLKLADKAEDVAEEGDKALSLKGKVLQVSNLVG
jgi:small subunit ribosomal protein S6